VIKQKSLSTNECTLFPAAGRVLKSVTLALDIEIMKPQDYISRAIFFAKYNTVSNKLYYQFCSRIKTSLEPTLDKEVSVDAIGFHACWKDAGQNIHCSLKGQVSRLNETGNIHGEIVLLRKSAMFRGGVRHDLKIIEDWEWIQKAKKEFSKKHYNECLRMLSLLKNSAIMTPSNVKMQTIANERSSNK